MAGSAGFKEYARLERIVAVEDAFNKGMQYTDNPLDIGSAKILVNFDLKNQGKVLTPRGGMQDVKLALTGLEEDLSNYLIHHVGDIYISNADETDATIHKYILLVKKGTSETYDFSTTKVLIKTDDDYVLAVGSFAFTSGKAAALTSAHGLKIANGSSGDNRGIYASLDANTYIPVKTSTSAYIAQLKLKFNADKTAASVTMPTLEPEDIKASRVINAGYNMLLPDPYAFTNTSNVTGAVVLEGLIPKDSTGNVKLNADVGEEVVYHLHYSYPIEHATEATKKQYVALWKVKNVNSSEDATVLQRIRASKVYTPGDAITLPYKVAYKQYTMVVELYDKAVVDALTYVSDEDDYKQLKPLQAITVSSYYTSASNKGTNANLTMKNYDLSTCKGMCTWQQRMVLWGVSGALNTLWVSQTNQPAYFPYPNNVEVFQEPIMKCVPYLTNLLVFTASKLYMLTMAADSNETIYYSSKCIQERLVMTEEDASTIQVVKNMVYFKSGSYYYMIVPSSAYGAGELQIAPVSNSITTLLDTFPQAVEKIVDSVYNLNYVFNLASDTEHYALECVEYTNYLDGNTVRNSFRFNVIVTEDSTTGQVTKHNVPIVFSLNYDTILRAWTIYLYQCNDSTLVPYQQTITDSMIFANRTTTGINLVQFVPTAPADVMRTDVRRYFKNYQMINTGYRNHYKDWKKRFREIQFTINSTDQAPLQFHSSFTVDDDVRKEFYDYTIEHVTDKSDVNYGLIYIERSLSAPMEVECSTAYNDGEGWTLDLTKFPDISVVKVRYKVSGKGYVGKTAILSTNESMYELLGVNWVYRKMNAR